MRSVPVHCYQVSGKWKGNKIVPTTTTSMYLLHYPYCISSARTTFKTLILSFLCLSTLANNPSSVVSRVMTWMEKGWENVGWNKWNFWWIELNEVQWNFKLEFTHKLFVVIMRTCKINDALSFLIWERKRECKTLLLSSQVETTGMKWI